MKGDEKSHTSTLMLSVSPLGIGNSTGDTTDHTPPPCEAHCVCENEGYNDSCEQLVLTGPKCDPCIFNGPQNASESTMHTREEASCMVSGAIASCSVQPSTTNTSDGSKSVSQNREHTAQCNPDNNTGVVISSHNKASFSNCEAAGFPPHLVSTPEQDDCRVGEADIQDREIHPNNSSGSDISPSSTATSLKQEDYEFHDRIGWMVPSKDPFKPSTNRKFSDSPTCNIQPYPQPNLLVPSNCGSSTPSHQQMPPRNPKPGLPQTDASSIPPVKVSNENIHLLVILLPPTCVGPNSVHLSGSSTDEFAAAHPVLGKESDANENELLVKAKQCEHSDGGWETAVEESVEVEVIQAAEL